MISLLKAKFYTAKELLKFLMNTQITSITHFKKANIENKDDNVYNKASLISLQIMILLFNI